MSLCCLCTRPDEERVSGRLAHPSVCRPLAVLVCVSCEEGLIQERGARRRISDGAPEPSHWSGPQVPSAGLWQVGIPAGGDLLDEFTGRAMPSPKEEAHLTLGSNAADEQLQACKKKRSRGAFEGVASEGGETHEEAGNEEEVTDIKVYNNEKEEVAREPGLGDAASTQRKQHKQAYKSKFKVGDPVMHKFKEGEGMRYHRGVVKSIKLVTEGGKCPGIEYCIEFDDGETIHDMKGSELKAYKASKVKYKKSKVKKTVAGEVLMDKRAATQSSSLPPLPALVPCTTFDSESDSEMEGTLSSHATSLHRRTSRRVMHIHPEQRAALARAKQYGQEVLGRRLSIYWPPEKMWFRGCIKDFSVIDETHYVVYDDGDAQWEALGNSEALSHLQWEQEGTPRCGKPEPMVKIEPEDLEPEEVCPQHSLPVPLRNEAPSRNEADLNAANVLMSLHIPRLQESHLDEAKSTVDSVKISDLVGCSLLTGTPQLIPSDLPEAQVDHKWVQTLLEHACDPSDLLWLYNKWGARHSRQGLQEVKLRHASDKAHTLGDAEAIEYLRDLVGPKEYNRLCWMSRTN